MGDAEKKIEEKLTEARTMTIGDLFDQMRGEGVKNRTPMFVSSSSSGGREISVRGAIVDENAVLIITD